MSAMLINQANIRRYIKDRFSRTRPHLGITRVSKTSLQDIDAIIRQRIDKAVRMYPSIGKTFLYCQ